VIVALTKKLVAMGKTERLRRLAVLGTKQLMGVSDPLEDLEVELIQLIRRTNGEIEDVLRSWESDPEMAELARKARAEMPVAL
jgi:hypothetical protein